MTRRAANALINATRQLRCPDHVPDAWVKEHRK